MASVPQLIDAETRRPYPASELVKRRDVFFRTARSPMIDQLNDNSVL